MKALKAETYYDVLKIEPNATTSEIVAAYHRAKNAFSKDSLATYSLFNPDEVQPILERLEEAYQTLTNSNRRAQYDQSIRVQITPNDLPLNLSERASKAKSQILNQTPPPPVHAIEPVMARKPAETPVLRLERASGADLKAMREKLGFSVEDVTRTTRIPLRHLTSIENDTFSSLPARVYVQGYVKNLATLYRLDPRETAKAYLQFLDQHVAPPK